jgi:hypothetical protein
MKRGWKQLLLLAVLTSTPPTGFNQNLNEKRMETNTAALLDAAKRAQLISSFNQNLNEKRMETHEACYGGEDLTHLMFQSKPQ